MPSTVKQINALAAFSLYAGIGRKTPMGMGQTFYGELKTSAVPKPRPKRKVAV